MATRTRLSFLLNEARADLETVPTDGTLLEFLRLTRRSTGTKEGCGEGDCGACTVLVGRLRTGRVSYEPVNACIRPLASVDGCHVVTIEHLGGARGTHPLQEAMVGCHGSQCGFCTPGMVMALEANRLADAPVDTETALQGNLCRCTGYGPILRAARTVGEAPMAEDPLVRANARTAARLAEMADGADLELSGPGGTSWLPASIDSFAATLAARPEARIVAGATDFALNLTKRLEVPPALIFTGRVAGFDRIEARDGRLHIGPGVTFAQAMPVLDAHLPQLSALWRRIGGPQVRHAGTLVGNIANGSPIGDGPPVWIALGARLILRHGTERRALAVEDYFIDYGRQDRKPGEFIEELVVPLPENTVLLAAHKVSKRFDEDISAVLGAFHLRREGDVVAEARIAFGGMAGIPKRAAHVEAALTGRPWDEATLHAALPEFARDFTPMDDMRASAEYRLTVARNLLVRVWLASRGVDTDLRELAHV
ncbi:xanthine dehydrogenase small subunit [Celeribacter indicus]|uniref:Xanthine dehydrogenase small subunit n=1 Tax=Celeribacter indicus TaxID=1208324 RepID=A0A0B5DVU6_9RHOB|nr:xanthine dehydrogenase small subunit [Celeribacter indicus]AJE47119.1 xanthine dehydrogenase small subunit [Celeribacter indicus]SDW90357.1 xanthine dehydrogenase small subunit [Celeribacter indicus]